MIVKPLDHYTPEIANRVRELLIQLSRSGKDKGEIPEDWFNDIINSPWHDLLVAEEDGKILGIASVSVTMGPGIRKNAYLEDFVTDSEVRGKGVKNPKSSTSITVPKSTILISSERHYSRNQI